MENRVQINTSVSLSIDMLGRLECEAGWVGKEHSHHFWEIIMITKNFEDFKISLVYPNKPHCFRNDLGADAHILYVGFRTGIAIDDEETEAAVLAKLQDRCNFPKYAAFFDEVKCYGSKGGANSSLLFDVFTFLTDILCEYMPETDVDEQHSIVSEIKKYITLNIDKALTVKDIAGTLYLSPKYIGNVFKKKTGMGILQYQKAKKMERALSYLKSGTHSVKEVSVLLGFENVAYFSNTFKDYYGLSPINYLGNQDRKKL